MTITTTLVQNIADIIQNNNNNMMGGRLNNSNHFSQNKHKNFFIMLAVTLLFLLLKGLIVYLTFNFMAPKLIHSLVKPNDSPEHIEANFKQISYTDSILFVILFNTLFSF
jgi:hypothetical protein